MTTEPESTGQHPGRWVQASYQRHAQAILDIFNDAIEHSTASFDLKPWELSDVQAWLDLQHQHQWPVLGLESDDGDLMGFASYGAFRPHLGYAQTMEHSVYVQTRWRGQGLGHRLMQALMAQAWQCEVQALVGMIESGNSASIRLHHKLGFQYAGTLRQAGRKFGRWLDVDLYQFLRPRVD